MRDCRGSAHRQTPSADELGDLVGVEAEHRGQHRFGVGAHERRGLGAALRETREAQRIADVALVADLGVVQRHDRSPLEHVRIGVVVVRAHDRHGGDAVRLEVLGRVLLRT